MLKCASCGFSASGGCSSLLTTTVCLNFWREHIERECSSAPAAGTLRQGLLQPTSNYVSTSGGILDVSAQVRQLRVLCGRGLLRPTSAYVSPPLESTADVSAQVRQLRVLCGRGLLQPTCNYVSISGVSTSDVSAQVRQLRVLCVRGLLQPTNNYCMSQLLA